MDSDADVDFGWEGTCCKHLGWHSQLEVERMQDVVEAAFHMVVGPCALDLEVDTFAAGVAEEDIHMHRDRREVEDSLQEEVVVHVLDNVHMDRDWEASWPHAHKGKPRPLQLDIPWEEVGHMQLTVAVDASNPCRRSLARPPHGVKAFLDSVLLFSSCGLDEVTHAENCECGTWIRDELV